jgi:hypothetical protein
VKGASEATNGVKETTNGVSWQGSSTRCIFGGVKGPGGSLKGSQTEGVLTRVLGEEGVFVVS